MADSQRKTANLFNIDDVLLQQVNDVQRYAVTYTDVGTYSATAYGESGDYCYMRIKHSDDTWEDSQSIVVGSSINIRTMTISEGETLYIYCATNVSESVALARFESWQLMVNKGNTVLPYEPYGWVHSLRKQCSATETITSGQTIYANGQPITTYNIKGNTVQSGTPTPSNPVAVNGVGERTENLYNKLTAPNLEAYPRATDMQIKSNTESRSTYIPCKANTTYTVVKTAGKRLTLATTATTPDIGVQILDITENTTGTTSTITTDSTAQYLVVWYWYSTDSITEQQMRDSLMIIEGSTAPSSYEPYGYKIPISSADTTTPVYLGEVESTRQIRKYELTGTETPTTASSITSTNAYQFRNDITDYEREAFICSHMPVNNSSSGSGTHGYTGTYLTLCFDKAMGLDTTDKVQAYLAQQYANGTPVTVWYVLSSATTGIVNEPLMKIDTYADSVSNATAIPTTEGANTITVDTTVQPSEFTAAWTGWHDAEVKEYQGGVGNQKFDYTRTDGVLRNAYINQQGQTVENPSYDTSYMIAVQPNTIYTWNFASTVSHRAPTAAFYDSNGNYISVAEHGQGTYFSFTTPNNCAYVRVPIYISDKAVAMLNEGSTVLPYESYQYGWA